jgi:hypothetical protein
MDMKKSFDRLFRLPAGALRAKAERRKLHLSLTFRLKAEATPFADVPPEGGSYTFR